MTNEDELINYAMPLRLLTDAQVIGLYKTLTGANSTQIGELVGKKKVTIDKYVSGVKNDETRRIRFELITRIIDILERC